MFYTDTFCNKVLLLIIVFSALVCFNNTKHAYAVSQSSQKSDVKKVYTSNYTKRYNIKKYKVASEDYRPLIGNADANSVVSYAKKYLGARYVYGASGPNSFDCSGFTMYVMSILGIDLPHSASGQSAYGIKVSKKMLSPGDFVFFDTSNGNGISHVGIYIGGGNFIHASSRGVVISNLNERYYDNRYVTAKRLIE